MRTAYLAAVMRNLTAMLDQLGWVEIPLDSTIHTLAIEYMARYALGSHDTVHLASARYARVADLASFDEAEDAVQETLLNAWRAREGFDGSLLFRAWLYRIATNVCLRVELRPCPARFGATPAASSPVGGFGKALTLPSASFQLRPVR